MTVSDFSRKMEGIHELLGRRDYAVASRECLKLARKARDVDQLAAFHLRITASFLDLIEHGRPSPQALQEIEDLLAAAVREIDYDDRVEMDLAAVSEFCRLFRLCLQNEGSAVAETYRERQESWLAFGGSVEVMSYMIASLYLLNRDLRGANTIKDVRLLDGMGAGVTALLTRRGLHRYVGEVLMRCSEFIDNLSHGIVVDGETGGPGFNVFGVVPMKNPWMLCAESLLRTSTALARRMVMSSKYNINAQVVNVIEHNAAPINIDARAMDVDMAGGGDVGSQTADGMEGFEHSPDFRRIRLRGEVFRFGVVQATMIRILHDASKASCPWVPVRQLLDEAKSGSEDLRRAFANHDRHALFETDDLGRVRLRL